MTKESEMSERDHGGGTQLPNVGCNGYMGWRREEKTSMQVSLKHAREG